MMNEGMREGSYGLGERVEEGEEWSSKVEEKIEEQRTRPTTKISWNTYKKGIEKLTSRMKE